MRRGGAGRHRRASPVHFRRAATGSTRTRPARPAPDDRPSGSTLWRLRELRARAPAVGRGRLPLPLRRPRQPARRAPLRARRGARPDAGARRDGRIVALPELERMSVGVRSRRSARVPVASARRRARLHWNRCCCTSGRRSTSRPPRRSRGHRTGFARIEGSGWGSRWSSAARAPSATSRSRRVRDASSPAGRGGRRSSSPTRRRSRSSRSTPTPSRIVSARRRGLVYPYELIVRARSTGGTFVEHDLDDDGELVPVDRPAGHNKAGIVVGLIRNLTERYPEGMQRVDAARRPDAALGSLAEPECRASSPRSTSPSGSSVPVEWFALSAGAKIAMDSGTENMDWVAAVLRRIIEFTQAGGEVNVVVAGHQRRRPAVLERRGDDAHAHQGHPRDDARERDGAHRQAGARLLRRRVGRGQPRHRRLRAHHGPQRPGAVLGAPTSPAPATCCSPLRAHATSRPASASRAAPTATTRSTATSAAAPHERGRLRLHDGRRRSSPTATNPDRKKPFDIRARDARGGRPRPAAARALGRACATPRRRWCGTRTSAATRCALIGIESRPLPRYGSVPADGPGTWTSGTLFPLSSKKVARAINAASGQPPARGARQPVRLRRLARVDAPPAARVRRRDRARGRQLRRPDRVLRGLPLPRRRVRGVLAASQRQHRGGRARGRVRVGDRRRAGRGGRVRPRGRRAHAQATRGSSALDEQIAGAERRRARAPAGRARERCDRRALGEARRGGRRVRRRSTASSAPSRSARSTASSRPPSCGPT